MPIIVGEVALLTREWALVRFRRVTRKTYPRELGQDGPPELDLGAPYAAAPAAPHPAERHKDRAAPQHTRSGQSRRFT